MKRFKSQPGTRVCGVVFDKEGFYQTSDQQEIEALSKACYVTDVSVKEEPQDKAPQVKPGKKS